MFQSKATGALLTLFALVSVMSYLQLSNAQEEQAVADATERLRIAHRAAGQGRALNDFALAARAAQIAASPGIANALTAPLAQFNSPEGKPPTEDDYRYGIHKLMNEEVAVFAAQFASLADGKAAARNVSADWRREKPDLFYVVNADGIGVARPDDKAWYGIKEGNVVGEHPALSAALASDKGSIDLWLVKDVPTVVAIEPVRAAGAVVGAVVLGYRLTDSEAKKDQGPGVEVAYFIGDRIRQSSSVDTGRESALSAVFKAGKLYELKSSARDLVTFTLAGPEYMGFIGRISETASAKNAGYIVFANRDAVVSKATAMVPMIAFVFFITGLLALAIVIFFFRIYNKPYEDIDQGILEIINGNLDRWFELTGTHPAAHTSQNLNIMVCQLTGRPLPDEEETSTPGRAQAAETWAEDKMFIEAIDPSEFRARPVDASQAGASSAVGVSADSNSQSGLAPDILRLIRETDDAYRRRIFEEYRIALRANGEPTGGITAEKFLATLESNAELLRTKYRCGRVRFLVQTRDGRVSLKPVPIT